MYVLFKRDDFLMSVEGRRVFYTRNVIDVRLFFDDLDAVDRFRKHLATSYHVFGLEPVWIDRKP